MERGTEREYEVVRREWAAMERRRRSATRLLAGGSLGLFAALLLLFAVASDACIGDGGIPPHCTVVFTGPANAILLLAGVVALASGLWLCWSGFRR